MTEKLGEIDYTKEEFLYYNADYEKMENTVTKSEMIVIDNAESDEEEIPEDATARMSVW